MVIKQPEMVTAIIEKAKRELIDKTNICDSPEEMQVLSDMMFRLWQMGWLDKIFQETEPGHVAADPDEIPAEDESMSVLIKGLKMPKECADCYIRERDTCPLLKANVSGWGRMGNCPIIELPDHGDLIDRDTLMCEIADWQLAESPDEGRNWWLGKNVTSHEMQYGIYRLLGDVYEEVRDIPVVIPAERNVKVCPLSTDDEVTEYCVEGPCTAEMEGRCPIAERSEDE